MDEPRVVVLLLGPLECRVDDQVIELGSRSRRVLLAILALQAPRVVSRDDLVDGLWGESPPPSARNSLEAHISRLRGAAPELADAVHTRAPGYALDATTDLRQLEELRAAATEKLSAGDAGSDDPSKSAREAIIPIVNGPRGVDNPQRQGLQSAVAGEGDPLNIIREEPECSDPTVPANCSALQYSPLWDVTPVAWTQAAIDAGLRVRLAATRPSSSWSTRA